MATRSTGGCGCSSAPAPATATQQTFVEDENLAALRRELGAAAPAELGAGGFFDWSSLKGEALTQALALSGYATDADALRAHYRSHKDAIDGYVDYIDTEEVLKALGSSGAEAAKGLDTAALVVGVMGGAAALAFIQQFTGNKKKTSKA